MPGYRLPRSGLGRSDGVLIGQFADALSSLMAEFVSLGPESITRVFYIFLFYPSRREEPRKHCADDHTGDGNQPRIAPKRFSHLTGSALCPIARRTTVIGIPRSAIEYSGARLTNRIHRFARCTRGLIHPSAPPIGIAAMMSRPTIRPQ